MPQIYKCDQCGHVREDADLPFYLIEELSADRDYSEHICSRCWSKYFAYKTVEQTETKLEEKENE